MNLAFFTLSAGLMALSAGADSDYQNALYSRGHKGGGTRTKKKNKSKSFGKSTFSRLSPKFGSDKDIWELDKIKNTRKNIFYHSNNCSCFACYKKRQKLLDKESNSC